jgi:hypothetical protein
VQMLPMYYSCMVIEELASSQIQIIHCTFHEPTYKGTSMLYHSTIRCPFTTSYPCPCEHEEPHTKVQTLSCVLVFKSSLISTLIL